MSENTAIIYGFHAVTSLLLKEQAEISYLLADSHRHDERMKKIINLAQEKNISLRYESRKNLSQLTGHEHHQGIIAIVKPRKISEDLIEHLDSISKPFLLILDGVQDPHNLGACLRSANCAGVDAVVAPKDRAVGITPVVSKVASGADLFTPFFQVTNLARTMETLKERGIWLYGTSEHATDSYNEVDLRGAVGIVMGSEGKGLRRLTEEHCDYLIHIPMFGTVPSLNVSVATGICLFEVVRQQNKIN